MPKEIDGVTYFTQEEVNGLTGTARTDGRTAAEKHLFKSLGVESVDAAKLAIDNATVLGTQVNQLTTQLASEQTQRTEVIGKFKVLSLERAADTVGAEFKLTPGKCQQVLKLLTGVKADEFDADNKEHVTGLKTQFKAFLDDPENAHFANAGVPETPGRKPGANAPEKENEWSKLRSLVTAAKR